jgi:hypothetical protein
MSGFRKGARRTERFLFYLLDSLFNGGAAYRASRRNETLFSREATLRRLTKSRRKRAVAVDVARPASSRST